MPTSRQLETARARQLLYGSLRRYLSERGFSEVETPSLVPHPGMEPHIRAFEVPYQPETEVGRAATFYLHTSPEYAMKRLLADGAGAIFQLCKVFRNGEISRTHNPEFTLLELYRPNADYHQVMQDLEYGLSEAERAVRGPRFFSQVPYERLTVREALLRETGIDLREHSDLPSLTVAARRLGISPGPDDGFDDLFFRIFLERVEPKLGLSRPTFLYEYPASMAALSRLCPEDPSVAERFELYARGLELANGFSELTDPAEQRRRLKEEQALRAKTGRPVYKLDEKFLEAVGRMPPCAGVAVGLDRILMLLVDAAEISDVLLFPAHDFFD